MPPKVRINKEDIISAALELIRQEGADAINARAIASALGCSTQPIFSNFASMEELEGEVMRAAYSLYFEFIKNEEERAEYPKYKSFGMAYIRFAKEERELFKFLFMRYRHGEDITPSADFDMSVELIMNANGISRERAALMHLEMWSTVHGIATMLATSFLELDFELISRMLSDVYLGARERHITQERENGSYKN